MSTIATVSRRRAKSLPYLAFVLLLSLIFLLRSPYSPSPPNFTSVPSTHRQRCNYSSTGGEWILSPDPVTSRYDSSCKEIFKGWNCVGKSNQADLNRWIWKPNDCDHALPRLDPVRFLERFRNTNASGNGGYLESLGFKEGYRVDVDIPEHTWADALNFHDILIFNTGHWWWAPSKFDPVKSPMLFFKNGVPVVPPLSPEKGLDLTLKHMIAHVDGNTKADSIKIFRTQSPRHFEGGDWNQGGSCRRLHPLSFDEVEELFSLENNGTNVEARLVNKYLYKALKGSDFGILDITHMSEFRADAHPSVTGGKKHEDCMHWCLPGLTDSWNDLLVQQLLTM